MKVKVIVKKSGLAKNASIKIKKIGEVLITLPWWKDKNSGLEIARENRSWIVEKMNQLKEKLSENGFSKTRLLDWGNRQDYLKNREKARRLANLKILKFNEFYRFDVGRIAIRDQNTRWGSCSSKKNLNFNYRVVKLPEELVDYLVVHELCHLREMNHSKSFWDLVKKTIPNCKLLSKKLRKI